MQHTHHTQNHTPRQYWNTFAQDTTLHAIHTQVTLHAHTLTCGYGHGNADGERHRVRIIRRRQLAPLLLLLRFENDLPTGAALGPSTAAGTLGTRTSLPVWHFAGTWPRPFLCWRRFLVVFANVLHAQFLAGGLLWAAFIHFDLLLASGIRGLVGSRLCACGGLPVGLRLGLCSVIPLDLPLPLPFHVCSWRQPYQQRRNENTLFFLCLWTVFACTPSKEEWVSTHMPYKWFSENVNCKEVS